MEARTRSIRFGRVQRCAATVSVIAGKMQRAREDLALVLDVTTRPEGNVGSATADVPTTLSKLHLPPPLRVEFRGLYAQHRQSFADMTMVFCGRRRHPARGTPAGDP